MENLFDDEAIFSRKMEKMFNKDISDADDLLDALNDDKVFDRIFEVIK